MVGDDDLDFDLDDDEVAVTPLPSTASDRAIERDFDTGRLRVVQDRNDFFLPHVVDFIEGRKWGNLRPEYQRRLRWDVKKKSRLIESFVMNVPVPPVFLYERDIGAFEVMDGQQRLNTILEFLKNEFELSGLTIWPSLNGRTFGKLPPLIRRGLERSKISAITLMSDSSMSKRDSIDLRAQVFDRLNTGGERLNPQELRNSLYSGRFNKMIIDLAGHEHFTTAWDIPSHKENMLSDGSPSLALKENILFKRMMDCEIALRFFAFRDTPNVTGSVKSILDNCMKRNRALDKEEIADIRKAFLLALSTSIGVFGKKAFRIPSTKSTNPGSLSRPLFDAEMVSFDRLSDHTEEILSSKTAVRKAVLKLAMPGSSTYDLIVGRANTAAAIRERIDSVESAIKNAL